MVLKRRKAAKVYKAHNPPPGTIIYQGKRAATSTSVEIFNYSLDEVEKKESQNIEDAFNYKDKNSITWININGLNDTDNIEKLGNHYDIHSLVLEDIVNTNQRPKIDEFDDYLFIAFKMLYIKDDSRLVDEHVSLIVGDSYVLTFQEADGDVFDSIRDRIMNKKGRVRTVGSDYLAYVLLDAVVDHYYTIIDSYADSIEDLENDLFTSTTDDSVAIEIQRLKRLILKIRKSIFPFREVVNRLEKLDHPIVDSKTQSYIRDLYDHILQVTESIDLYREMVWGLMDMHMNILSNKMNEVMKVLTIMATIFIPLTFIAGIYGMNFEYIPELEYRYSYFILWGVMIVIFIFMLAYFRRKKWL